MHDDTLMDSISSQAQRRINDFEGSDFSSTAWAFSALGLQNRELWNAISSEVIRKISSIGAQSLGTLVDVGLPCLDIVKRRLQLTLSKFADGIPGTLDAYKRGDYVRHVEELDVDNFGSVGDRHLLQRLGITAPSADFSAKARLLVMEYNHQHEADWWRSEGLLRARVVSYAEFHLVPHFCQQGSKPTSGPPLPHRGELHGVPLCGHRYQTNGYQGVRQSEERITPTPLPCNRNVDRSLCSEFQLLAAVVDELATGGPDPSHALAKTRGNLQLYVTGAPCLSCVGAMHQFRLLLPDVHLEVAVGEELAFDAMTNVALSVTRRT